MAGERPIIEPSVIRGFSEIDCACISDVLGGLKIKGVAHGIVPLARGMKVCGPAVTMRQIASRDERNWARHEKVLVEMCRQGDVLVMDCGGRMDGAPWGANVAYEARTRGLNGTVIDGVTRDCEEILEIGNPLFCRGVTVAHTHGLFHSTCLNNEPVQIGVYPYAALVAPGDLVVGDSDGVVIVPGERAAEILDLAQRRHEEDLRMLELLRAGKVHGDPEVDQRVANTRGYEGVQQAENYKW